MRRLVGTLGIGMRRVSFGPWQIDYDSDATAGVYAPLIHGEAAECGCDDCLSWIEQRGSVLPREFVNFLRLLGIDPTKETEVSEYEAGHVQPEVNLYIGEYAFVGDFLSGPDCFDVHADRKGATHQLAPLFEDLEVGVSSNREWVHRGRLSIPKHKAAVVMFKVHTARGHNCRSARTSNADA
jgi:hypothetical protein